ncbi:hypothetical protein B7494_g4313 [Chlorociboria aeruginascens]|nr:hypothetical protein B7494_g4313 [Chlorociboria aeruginascens]
MFAGLAHNIVPSNNVRQRDIPPPPPLSFPECTPKAEGKVPSSRENLPLAALLQTIHRPYDIQLSHFEALGLHVIQDASPEDIMPDASYLPPVEQWTSIPPDALEQANEASRKPLNNGNLSPGVQTFLERRNELSIDNVAAFRTIRRIPPPSGTTLIRLGNAYEFFKNLELFSAYWDDTSIPESERPKPTTETNDDSSSDNNAAQAAPPPYFHVRTGNGAQLPAEYRQHLLTAFLKLVAYDFGCNVTIPRVEPRLQIAPASSPASFFSCVATFIYRTPTDRSSARSGVNEGPLAVLSCRNNTSFDKDVDSKLDLAKEVVAALVTAQQRAREGREEKRYGVGMWWSEKGRWGGGPGGAIGRESDKADELKPRTAPTDSGSGMAPSVPMGRSIGGINGPSPSKRSKKLKGDMLQIYDNYRKMLPPSSTWDRKVRYSAIGKQAGEEFDDVFLISGLNHHVSIIRIRVPMKLLVALDGKEEQWERMVMWRSKWYDFFLTDERLEALQLVWGMMAYLMKKAEDPETSSEQISRDSNSGGGKMDVDK